MSGRIMVAIDSLSEEITETNNCLQERINGAQKCIDALQAYCTESKLKGEAYTNSQTFFYNSYIWLLNQVKYLCELIFEKNNTILPTFSIYVPDTRGFAADTQELEEEINRLKNENLGFEKQISYYTRLSIINAPFQSSNGYNGMITWYQGRIKMNDCEIAKLQTVINNIRNFNSACSGIYEDINTIAQKLVSAITQLKENTAWNTENKRFIIPSGLTDCIKSMQYDLVQQMGESEEKDEEIINLLFPEWNRDLLEAIESCPVGESITVTKSYVTSFPDGSSLTYEISAKVTSSSASIVDINANIVKQSATLNCGGYSFSENGVNVPVMSTTQGDSKVTISAGVEIDYYTMHILLRESYTTSTTIKDSSISSTVTVKKPVDDSEPDVVPEVVPIEEPSVEPWYDTAWDWLFDTTVTNCIVLLSIPVRIKNFKNDLNNDISNVLDNMETPDPVIEVASELCFIVGIAFLLCLA